MGIRPDRYTLENARRLLREPGLARRELFTLAVGANRWASRLRTATTGAEGVDVLERDWDTLVILDACRYDLFEPYSERLEGGTLTAVRSHGSDSWEFLRENFERRTAHDTVYVTANPHVGKLADGTFHAVANALETHWDETSQTVPPATMADLAVETRDRYPRKRLIVHFMQPHFPFLGPTGETFDHRGLEVQLGDGTTAGAPNPWYALVHGDTDRETVLTAYRENLELTLPHVERILGAVPGKTVVTADHGNLVGERGVPVPVRLYGHPRGLHRPELLTVPWYEVVHGDRPVIEADAPVEGAKLDHSTVDDRLAALGYV